MNVKTTFAAIVAATAMTGAASAATVSYSDTLDFQSTNFADQVLSLTQFDPTLGTLNSVSVTLDGTVLGNASGESRDAASATVTLNLSAEITASTAALDSLAVVLPVASESFAATAFDGSIDFGGTSGVSLTGLTATESAFSMLTGTDMAEFIGAGTVDILIGASGIAYGSGAGNLITEFATEAGANVTVVYDYDPSVTPPAPVPLPAGLPLLALGMGALAIARRRKG